MTSQQRIAEAVRDDRWQAFRVSLKGYPTSTKLMRLRIYFVTAIRSVAEDWLAEEASLGTVETISVEATDAKYHLKLEDIQIRVDNYIKALVRGGFLSPGENLDSVIDANWKPPIEKE